MFRQTQIISSKTHAPSIYDTMSSEMIDEEFEKKLLVSQINK